jgi:hypothetical protein
MIEQKSVAYVLTRKLDICQYSGSIHVNLHTSLGQTIKAHSEYTPLFTESQLKAEVEMKDKIIKSLSDEVKSLELQLARLLNKQSHEEPKV